MADSEFPDLAKRQRKLRSSAAPPVSLTLHLQAPIFQSIAETAAERGMSVEDFAAWIINSHTEQAGRTVGEVL